MYIHIKGREEESVSDSKREERKRERTQKKLERSELREQKRLERENAKEQKRREEEEKQKQVFVCLKRVYLYRLRNPLSHPYQKPDPHGLRQGQL